MQDVVKRCRSKKVNLDVTDEDIMIFYQNYLKQKRLKDIVYFFRGGNMPAADSPTKEDQRAFNIDDTVEISLGPQFHKKAINDGHMTTASRKRRDDDKNLPSFIKASTTKKIKRKALSTVFNDMDP